MHLMMALWWAFFGFVTAQLVVPGYLLWREYRDSRKVVFQMRGTQRRLCSADPLRCCFQVRERDRAAGSQKRTHYMHLKKKKKKNEPAGQP